MSQFFFRATMVALLSVVCMPLCARQHLNAKKYVKHPFENASHFQPAQFKVGFHLGMEFPYSAGIEGSVLFHELVDINAGVGIGMSGAKVGIGTRVFPLRNEKFSPFIGAYLYHATGVGEVTVSYYDEEGVYKITPDNALLFHAGMRMRYGRGNYLLAGIGYAVPFEGTKAEYISGSDDPSVKDTADMFATGGFSISFGILLKISQGSYLED